MQSVHSVLECICGVIVEAISFGCARAVPKFVFLAIDPELGSTALNHSAIPDHRLDLSEMKRSHFQVSFLLEKLLQLLRHLDIVLVHRDQLLNLGQFFRPVVDYGLLFPRISFYF